MPFKPTEDPGRTEYPIGMVKDGRIKVVDGSTGKPVWRSAKEGMVKDLDGDPVSPARQPGSGVPKSRFRKRYRPRGPHKPSPRPK